jgi:hypothetical protein
MSKNLSQKSVIVLSLCFQAVQLGLFGLVTARWAIFTTTLVAAAGSMCYPAISALVSQTASAEQQVCLFWVWVLVFVWVFSTSAGSSLFFFFLFSFFFNTGRGPRHDHGHSYVVFRSGSGSVRVSLSGVFHSCTTFVVSSVSFPCRPDCKREY